MRDPNGTITCCAADCSIACGKDLTRYPSEHIFFMCAIQIARETQYHIENAWRAIRTVNLPEHRYASFSPVNGTISLLHGGLQTAFDILPAIIQGFWYKGATLKLCDRF